MECERMARGRTLELDADAAADVAVIRAIIRSPSNIDTVRRALRRFRADVETVSEGGTLIRRDGDGCETVTNAFL